MNKHISKISGIVFLLVIFAAYFLSRDQLIISRIQKHAISNFNSNIDYFYSIPINEELTSYYSAALIGNDSIYISVSNQDKRNIDYQTWDGYDRSPMNLNEIQIKSFNDSTGILTVELNGKVEKLMNWKMIYRGPKTDPIVIKTFEKLDIDMDKFLKQISILDKINCRVLMAYKGGIEMTYDEGFTIQSGCLVNKYYPVKYNIGKQELLTNIENNKLLDSRTQCYVYY